MFIKKTLKDVTLKTVKNEPPLNDFYEVGIVLILKQFLTTCM